MASSSVVIRSPPPKRPFGETALTARSNVAGLGDRPAHLVGLGQRRRRCRCPGKAAAVSCDARDAGRLPPLCRSDARRSRGPRLRAPKTSRRAASGRSEARRGRAARSAAADRPGPSARRVGGVAVAGGRPACVRSLTRTGLALGRRSRSRRTPGVVKPPMPAITELGNVWILRVVRLDVAVVDAPRGGDLVLGVRQLGLQLLEVLAGAQLRVGLGDREQPAQRLAENALGHARLRPGRWPASPARGHRSPPGTSPARAAA